MPHPKTQDTGLPAAQLALIALTLMATGRAMTLAFLGQVGNGGPHDPPAAWWMPLLGDAVIGITALPVAYLVWRSAGLIPWSIAVAWNAVAIWDALSAYAIHATVPWSSFFMIEQFGSFMFFAASAMHAVCIWLLFRRDVRTRFALPDSLSSDPAL